MAFSLECMNLKLFLQISDNTTNSGNHQFWETKKILLNILLYLFKEALTLLNFMFCSRKINFKYTWNKKKLRKHISAGDYLKMLINPLNTLFMFN